MARRSPKAAIAKTIEKKIKEIRADRVKAEKRGNAWTAVAQMHKLEFDLHSRLDEIRSPKTAATDGAELTDAQQLEEIRRMVRDLDDDSFEGLVEAVDARRAGRPDLRVVEGE